MHGWEISSIRTTLFLVIFVLSHTILFLIENWLVLLNVKAKVHVSKIILDMLCLFDYLSFLSYILGNFMYGYVSVCVYVSEQLNL